VIQKEPSTIIFFNFEGPFFCEVELSGFAVLL